MSDDPTFDDELVSAYVDGEATHEGGLASGKIFVKVPPENVEVAGTFTDATVSYRHTPDWTYH